MASPVYQLTAQHLRERIESAEVPTGDQLPAELGAQGQMRCGAEHRQGRGPVPRYSLSSAEGEDDAFTEVRRQERYRDGQPCSPPTATSSASARARCPLISPPPRRADQRADAATARRGKRRLVRRSPVAAAALPTPSGPGATG